MVIKSIFSYGLLLCSLLLCSFSIQAQAPGGVSVDLGVWLKANDFQVTGSAITSDWVDAGPGGNDGVHTAISGVTYMVENNRVNFNPAVSLDDEFFEIPLSIDVADIHVFTVYQLLQDNNVPVWGNGKNANGSEARQLFTKEHTNGTSTRTIYTSANIDGQAYLNHVHYSPTSVKVTANGSAITTSIASPATTTGGGIASGSFYLGRSYDDNRYLLANMTGGEMKVAECVVYTGALNTTAVDKINSYLAVKYGVTLPNMDYVLSSGVTIWDESVNAGYGTNIIGIAKDNGSSLSQEQSRSIHEGKLTLSATVATDLNATNAQALLLGNNGMNYNTAHQTEVYIQGRLLGQAERIERVWKAQKTGTFQTAGNSGGFTLAWDSPNLPPSFSGNTLVVLVADDAAFTQNVRAYPLFNNSGTLTATGVPIEDGQFITFAQPMASLWTKADATNNNITNNTVTQLNNQLFDANHFVGAVRSGNDHPDHLNDGGTNADLNFHPYVRFNDGNKNYIHIPTYHGFDRDEASIFMVVRRSNNSTPNNEELFSYAGDGTTNSGNEFLLGELNQLRMIIQQGNGGQPNNSGYNILNGQPRIVGALGKAGTGIELRLDGGSVTANYTSWSAPLYYGGSLTIGQEQDANLTTNPADVDFDNPQEYEGDWAELIVMNREATPEEKIDIETYLSLKYGTHLDHDYETDDMGTRVTLWDLAHSNGDYNYRITGVGHDPAFDWVQSKSQSQLANPVLTFSNATVGTPKSFLICGDNNADINVMSSTGAPANHTISDRIWYVRNYSDRAGPVEIAILKPSTLSSTSTGATLLVSGSPVFNGGGVASYPGTIQNLNGTDYVVFPNVALTDDQYFCVAESMVQTFANNDPGAPTTYEACVGSNVTFYYSGLGSHPTHVHFTSKNGGMTIEVGSVVQTSSNPAEGEITISSVPIDASTGPVELHDGNTYLYTYPGYLTIHNPDLAIYADKSLICADDVVNLNGVPSGGTFSGIPSGAASPAATGAVTSGQISGSLAGWSNINDSARVLRVQYDYLPTYISGGGSCAQPLVATRDFTIRDNRLSEVEFRSTRPSSRSPTYPLRIDSSVISQAVPNLLDPSFAQYGFPISFRGTYVDSVGPSQYDFLRNQASANNQVILRYNNGGCIGEVTGDLQVFLPISIVGVPDTLCKEASPIQITRDVSGNNGYQIDSTNFSYTFYNYGNGAYYRYSYYTLYERNVATGVFTTDPMLQNAIRLVSAASNNEIFEIIPDSLPAGVTSLAIEMRYTTYVTRTTTETNLSSSNIPPYIQSYNYDYYFTARDTITINPRPQLTLAALDSVYCASDSSFIIATTPAPSFSPVTRFEVTMDDVLGNFSHNDTLPASGELDIRHYYDRYVPNADRDLNMRIKYIVDRYGCQDEIEDTTQIAAPLEPIFLADTAYCADQQPYLLSVSWRPGSFIGSGNGVFDSIQGLSSAGLFQPRVAGAGLHPARYVFTDIFGCVSVYEDTLYVRTPPDIELELDGSTTNTRFCASDPAVLMSYRLQGGDSITAVQYLGAGVINNILYPGSVFASGTVSQGSGGTATVSVIVRDAFGCEGEDNLPITILPAPTIDIDASFTKPGTPYSYIDTTGASITIPIEFAYCRNDQTFDLNPTPTHNPLTGSAIGQITGAGVTFINGEYKYTPALVVDTTYADTVYLFVDRVYYTYTDNDGCTNLDSAIVQILPIPELSLPNLDTSYCANDSAFQVIPSPPLSQGTVNSGFAGPGFGPVSSQSGVTSDPTFDPSLAGVGPRRVTYKFTDNTTGCTNEYEHDFVIKPLPIPMFDGLNPNKQYCTASPLITLNSLNSITPPSSYYFTGALVIDSTGILDPGLFASTVTRTYTVYYHYTDASLCTNMSSDVIFVSPTPTLELAGLDSTYCINDAPARISVTYRASLTDTFNGYSTSAGTLQFDPTAVGIGYADFELAYSDPITTCSDTLVGRTYVHQPIIPTYAGLSPSYCKNDQDYMLTGTPNNGVFSGRGIVGDSVQGYRFNPNIAGVGVHDIQYLISDFHTRNLPYGGLDTVICLSDTQKTVIVNPLPDANIISPTNNTRFCSNDTMPLLRPLQQGNWHLFSSPTNGVFTRIDSSFVLLPTGFYVRRADTSYYFAPDSVVEGTHFVTYRATNRYGCTDTVRYTYIVDEYTEPFFALDTAYCESEPPVLLYGVPGGGTFTRDSNSIQTVINGAPYFTPNLGYSTGNYLNTSILDTVIYSVVDGACSGADTVVVEINPNPQVSYTTSILQDTFCLGMDPIALVPNDSGGVFTGNGIAFGTSMFQPNVAGVGIHPITYTFSDTSTGCSNSFDRTLSVYSMPNAQFSVVGGCQLDSSHFLPDNSVLGLTNILVNNQALDSITNVQWFFEPGVMRTGRADSNRVGEEYYDYQAPGIYYTQLIVANQVYCVDTHTVRLVISPKINSYPYDETFEQGAGDWYPESSTSSGNLLWEHGVDNTPQGIGADASNNIWVTALNQSYGPSEAAWVYSPCFDLDSLKRPMIRLDYWSDTRTKLDGAVLEYQKDDGTWAPVGEEDRGINWFNTDIISSRPGAQNIAPVGWSGQLGAWEDGRYKLDGLGGVDNTLRLRVAFASLSLPPNGYYDGFAFDNVWIGNRTRNVMLETTSHNVPQHMERDNRHVYDLVFHTELNKDVNMVQYHVSSPDLNDEFYQQSSTVSNSRGVVIGNATGGYALIDGDTSLLSYDLQAVDFEQSMLEDPKFDVEIDTFSHISNVFTIVTTVTANEDMPFGDYRIHTLITEDSLYYSNVGEYSDELQAVVRKDNGGGAPYTERRAWLAGETKRVVYTWDHSNDPFIQYEPGDFQAVVFIQDPSARQVFQSKTTRDVSGYWIGVNPIEAVEAYNEIQNVVLFPNPAESSFNLRFEAPLSTDYSWKLVSIHGQEVQTGTAEAGTELMTINSQDYSAGTYVLLLYNDQVFVQRKVVLRR